ncbi:MAG: peptidase [Herminiimonas sp.]|nr:peptidase [Herminiimonas sp.]
MERIQSINPDRIRWCCDDFGITPEQLAADVGISPASLIAVLAGEAGLTFNQLSKIASYFSRGILFFLEPGPVIEEQVHTLAFRTLANQKPELSAKVKVLIERVEQQREIYLSLRDEVAGDDLPKFSPTDLPANNVEEAAHIVRRWLDLSDRNTFDSYRAALERKGILVFRSNGYSGKWQIAKDSPILGFTLYDSECPVIVIKKQPWDTQQTFTLMHELGHLLLHKASSIDDDHDMHAHQGHEQEANAFAGCLLVPDEFLAQISDVERPQAVSEYDNWLSGHRRAWGISAEVILRRLLDNGRLSPQQYAAYRNWKAESFKAQDEGSGSRAYRNREPIHIFGDTFVRTVLDALGEQRITLAKASRYLDGLNISDLHKLESFYAGL